MTHPTDPTALSPGEPARGLSDEELNAIVAEMARGARWQGVEGSFAFGAAASIVVASTRSLLFGSPRWHWPFLLHALTWAALAYGLLAAANAVLRRRRDEPGAWLTTAFERQRQLWILLCVIVVIESFVW